MTRLLLFLLFSCVSFFGLAGGAHALEPFQTSAKQAILLDYETGAVLYEKNADQRMPTSSMSKVMTMYMVFDALKKGALQISDTFLVSEKAWRKGGSKMFVEVDKRVKVEDLIRGVIIQSGNDATIVLAEGLSGTEEAFAKAMTQKAHSIGMVSSNFANASGWPDPNHYSTARDLATLAGAMVRQFPEYYSFYSEREFEFNNIKQKNRNPLLYRNMGADGIKTGHTNIGGYGLIGSGMHNGRRVVLVVNGLTSGKARAQEGARLLEYGLRSFQNKTLFKAGEEIAVADVFMGRKKGVSVGVMDDMLITVPPLDAEKIKVDFIYDGPLKTPITKGQEIGVVKVTFPSNMKPVEYPVYTLEEVRSLGFFSKTFAKAKHFFAGVI